ncbi:MAG: (d)CMP kinase [Bacteroidetes bacterium]|jgi:cytidylate kinase|nr:(d)CMP kinase [Bacteroidota bacterium]
MQVRKKIIIAIDGFSSCGKSTFATEIARQLKYLYIDSGAMYRAFTWYCLRLGIINKVETQHYKLKRALSAVDIHFKKNRASGQHEIYVNNENVESYIRGVEVSDKVSVVSSNPEVRKKMIDLQKQLGKHRGVVMDGRDIGTVVFPDAELKIFMTAGTDIRAKRRYDELIAKGMEVAFEEIKMNIEHRDHLDLTRNISPLIKAQDALELDNSHMSIEQQMDWVMGILADKKIIEV